MARKKVLCFARKRSEFYDRVVFINVVVYYIYISIDSSSC